MMNRPKDSPDLLALIETVAHWDDLMDAAVTKKDKDDRYEEIVTAYMDPSASAYVGFQRALRVLGITDYFGTRDNLGVLAQMTTLYMEALALGAAVERQRSRG